MGGGSPCCNPDVLTPPICHLQDAATFLSNSGSTITLRYDMRYPFALWVGRQARALVQMGEPTAALESLRRYEVAWVRRQGIGRCACACQCRALRPRSS